MEKKKKLVAVYTRVSTATAQQLKSSENQQAYFEREIGNSDEYELYKIYADEGVSGTKLSRPEFNNMLIDAGLDIIEIKNNDDDERKEYKKYVTVRSSSRKPKFELILTKNTSRFARNVVVEDILRDLRNNNVFVKFLDLGKTTENKDDITYIQIFQSFDERESRDKSIKVRFGHYEGAEKGVIRTNSKLYGYKYIKEENRLEIIPQEADVIKLIFELYSNGYGIRRLSEELTMRGIFNRNNKPWGKTSLLRIINNEKYYGVNNALKYDTGEVFSKNSYPKVKKHYELRETDKIPPIISKELFYACQSILKGKVNHINNKGIYNGKTKYSGKLFCYKCGKPYYANKDKGRAYYICKTKKEKGISACDNINISQNKFEKKLERIRKNYKKLKEEKKEYMLDMVYLQMFYLIEQLDIDNSIDIANLNITIQTLEQQIKNLLPVISMGNAAKELALDEINKLNNEIENCKSKIDELSKSNDDILKLIEKLENNLEYVHNLDIKEEYTTEEVLKENIFFVKKKDTKTSIKNFDEVLVIAKDNIEEIVDNLFVVDESIMNKVEKSKLYFKEIEDEDGIKILIERKEEHLQKLNMVRNNMGSN